MKICSKCKEEKEYKHFLSSKGHKDGLTSQCRFCHNKQSSLWAKNNKDKHNIRSTRWRKENPEKAKEIRRKYNENNKDKLEENFLRNKYGILPKDKKDLILKQNNCCAICKKELLSPRDRCIDHDHITSKIRGILCRDCNLGLGKFKDNTTILLEAITYLNNNV